jgi:hypothetical protein
MSSKHLYRVIFHNHGKVYELYARGAGSSGMYGFVEVSDLVFGDSEGLVIDPTEERMRDEFKDVKVLHLPMHSVVRIEEVESRGTCIIRDRESGEKVTPFPVPGART